MSNISYLMDKLYNIDQHLGGKANIDAQKKGGDEFLTIQDVLMQNLHSIRSQIKEKEVKGKSADTIRLEIEIKDNLQESQKMLNRMNENLRKETKNTTKQIAPVELIRRQKLYDNFNSQIRDIKLALFSDSQLNTSFQSGNNQTLTDLKANLLDKGGQREPVVYQMSDQEKQTIQRWKQSQREQDEKLDQINQGVLDWKKASEKMGDAIDQTLIACQRLEKEIDQTNITLETSNAQLKKIITAYRQPNKFCLDFVLLAILLGLIVMLYYTLKE